MKAIVLAGGGGTRLWPVSTQNKPKQLHKLIGDTSLLEGTIQRIRPVFGDENIIIATGASHGDAVASSFAGSNIRVIVEPQRRDTLGAIGAAVALIAREDPNESFVVINSDAHVLDVEEYRSVLKKLESIVNTFSDQLLLVGLRPSHPETGYGYIEFGEPVSVGEHVVHRVKQFKEKPDLDTAKDYLRSGNFLWNPTMVSGTAKKFLNSVCKYEPEVYRSLSRLIDAEDFYASLEEAFEQMPRQTVDYGVLERETDMLVLPAEFGWTDIGSWKTIHDRSEHDDDDNVITGDVVTHNVKGSLIRNDTGRKVAVVGLEDIVVIETDGETLIMSKESAQDVKKIVEKLKDL